MPFFDAEEQGFDLSKRLQSKSTLILSLFVPHMKLESFVEFLFSPYLNGHDVLSIQLHGESFFAYLIYFYYDQ